MAQSASIVIPYAPRAPFLPYHARKHRWSVIVAHRRAGKTVACVNELLKAALTNARRDPPPRYAYIAPHFNQAKDVAWEYLKKYAAPVLQYGGQVNESELRVDLPNTGRVRLYGADNPDRLRGLYFDGVILDEFADMDPKIWNVIRPTLSDHSGWCTWIGTPKGHNEFYNVWKGKPEDVSEEWLRLMLKASQTGLLSEAELSANRRDMSKDQYAQEFECSFEAAIQGAYYGEDMQLAETEGRIRHVPYDRSVPVTTAWDLGIGDSTAIVFAQFVGSEIHIIDHLEASGVGLDWYAKELKAKPYVYGDHILPHDARAHELGTGKTRQETLASLGVQTTIAPQLGVDDGIQTVRKIFNRIYFDKDKCSRLIECLKQYRTEFDEKAKVFKPRPRHDWTSHSADALRYLAVGMSEHKGNWSEALTKFEVDWVV